MYIPLQASSLSLPADVIFTAVKFGEPAKLLRIESQTMTVEVFYSDPLAREDGLRALKWSPDRQKLAIVRIEAENPDPNSPDSYQRLCVLDRYGVLQQCLQEEAIGYRNEFGESQLDALTWSSDSQTIFYVSTLPDKRNVRLIEASAATGKTRRVLYEYPRLGYYAPPLFIWSLPDVVLLGSYFEQAAEYPLPLEMRSLTTQADQGYNLQSLFPNNQFQRVCSRSSPKGNYFVILSGAFQAQHMSIFNRQGQIVHTVTSTVEFPNLTFGSCPAWHPNESEFYFSAATTASSAPYLFRYSLQERKIYSRYFVPDVSLQKPELPYYSGNPFEVSPDGQHIVGSSGLGGYIVIYPPDETGDPLSFGGYDITLSPLWVPPLDE